MHSCNELSTGCSVPDQPLKMDGLNDSTQAKRIVAKAFLLTYSQTSLNKTLVYATLSNRPDVMRLIVGQEPHQDGNPHIHAYVVYNKARDATYKSFDIQGEHPNIQTHKPSMDPAVSMVNAWAYCRKYDQDPMVLGSPPPEVVATRKRPRDAEVREPAAKKQKKADLVRRCLDIAADKDESADAAYKYLMKHDPALAIERAAAYKLAFQAERTRCLCPEPAPRPIDSFTNTPTLPSVWRTLFITGPTRCGKTEWAKALLPKATVVRHKDQLKECDMSAGIIFDDFDTSHWPAAAVIHLLDWDQPSGIDVKHGYVMIPCHTRKIFTHNKTFEEWLGVHEDTESHVHGYDHFRREEKYPRTEAQLDACRRRVSVVQVNKKLYQGHSAETPQAPGGAPGSEDEDMPIVTGHAVDKYFMSSDYNQPAEYEGFEE